MARSPNSRLRIAKASGGSRSRARRHSPSTTRDTSIDPIPWRHRGRRGEQVVAARGLSEIGRLGARAQRVGHQVGGPLVVGEVDQHRRKVGRRVAQRPCLADRHRGELHRLLMGEGRRGHVGCDTRLVAAPDSGFGSFGRVPVRRARPDQERVAGRLHRLRDRRVRFGPLPQLEAGDHGVPDQSVRERQARRPEPEQPGRDGGGEMRAHLRYRRTGGGGDERGGESFGQQSAGGDGTSLWRRQSLERPEQDAAQVAPVIEDPVEAAGDGSGGERADVEGVAPGACHEVVGQRQPAPQVLRRGEPGAHGLEVQARERDRHCGGAAHQRRQESGERRAGIVPGGDDDERAGPGQVHDEMAEHRQGRPVGPVHVLEHDDDSGSPRSASDRGDDSLTEVEQRGGVIGVRLPDLLLGRRQHRRHLGQIAADPPPRPQGWRPRVVHGVPPGGAEALAGGALQRLLGQQALADPRLAGDEEEATLPGLSVAPGRVDRGRLARPAVGGEHPAQYAAVRCRGRGSVVVPVSALRRQRTGRHTLGRVAQRAGAILQEELHVRTTRHVRRAAIAEQIAAAERANRERIEPLLNAHPDIRADLVATYHLRQEDGGGAVLVLSGSEATLDKAMGLIDSSELLPGEDPALLPGPSRLRRYLVTRHEVLDGGDRR